MDDFRYASVKHPSPVGWLASHDVIIGYLIEAGDRILLRADGELGWVPPTTRRSRVDRQLVLDGGETLSLVA